MILKGLCIYHGVFFENNLTAVTQTLCMAVYIHWTRLYWTGLLDWTTGFSLKSGVYRCTITWDLFVQCMRQDKQCTCLYWVSCNELGCLSYTL